MFLARFHYEYHNNSHVNTTRVERKINQLMCREPEPLSSYKVRIMKPYRTVVSSIFDDTVANLAISYGEL